MASDLSDAQIEEAFAKFDKDGSGSVSKKEVKAILTDMGLSEEDADSISTRIMDSADADGNDKLSLEEFKKELCA